LEQAIGNGTFKRPLGVLHSIGRLLEVVNPKDKGSIKVGHSEICWERVTQGEISHKKRGENLPILAPKRGLYGGLAKYILGAPGDPGTHHRRRGHNTIHWGGGELL